MKRLILLCLVALAVAIPPPDAFDDKIRNRVTTSQLDGVQCLEGDEDQKDQIEFKLDEKDPDLEGCFADKVGVKLLLHQSNEGWKGIRMHDKGNTKNFKSIIEEPIPVYEPYKPSIVLFPYSDFMNYDFCLWKEVDQRVSSSYRNVYLIEDASSAMQPGKVYTFDWKRDKSCASPPGIV